MAAPPVQAGLHTPCAFQCRRNGPAAGGEAAVGTRPNSPVAALPRGAVGLIELQRVCERFEHRVGGTAGIALFQSHVGVHAHAREQGNLLMAETRDATVAAVGRQPCPLRGDACPPGCPGTRAPRRPGSACRGRPRPGFEQAFRDIVGGRDACEALKVLVQP